MGVRLGNLACVAIACASCQTTPPATPAPVASVPVPPPTDRATTPAVKKAHVVRFSAGATPPPFGCFARSEARRSIACVVGREEAEPDGKKTGILTAIRFIGKDTPAPYQLEGGMLGPDIVIEHTCRTLDEGWEVMEVGVMQCDAKHCE